MSVLEDLAQAGEQRGIQFILIGGHAVNAYGYARVTVDVDLLVRKIDEQAWISALTSLGFQVCNDAGNFVQFNSPESSTRTPVDLMLVNDQTFLKLLTSSQTVVVQNTKLHIPALPHLIALKLHALAQNLEHRTLKDFLDVVELVRMNKLDLRSEEMKEIFKRYSNPELTHKLLVACEQQ